MMADSEAFSEAFSAGPLEGIRIIELGQLLAGSFAGRLLGDMGAEIVKVEAPGRPDVVRERSVVSCTRPPSSIGPSRSSTSRVGPTVELAHAV